MKQLIFLVFMLSLTSCFQDRIEIDLNEGNQKIVITAWITDLEERQFVTVGKTVNYLGTVAQEYVAGAVVKLINSSSELILEEGNNGKYFLPNGWTAVLGDTYTLTVDFENNTYTASHKMRSCPQMENVNYVAYDLNDFTDEEVSIIDSFHIYGTIFDFQESPGEGDAYYAIDFLKGTMQGDSMRNGGFANDDFVDGEYFEGIELSEVDRFYELGDTAVLEFYSIGIETANFLIDIESEIFRGSPFDPPPANVRTNFTGGAVGYFIISGAQSREIIIK